MAEIGRKEDWAAHAEVECRGGEEKKLPVLTADGHGISKCTEAYETAVARRENGCRGSLPESRKDLSVVDLWCDLKLNGRPAFI
jgi:hypothetical protein